MLCKLSESNPEVWLRRTTRPSVSSCRSWGVLSSRMTKDLNRPSRSSCLSWSGLSWSVQLKQRYRSYLIHDIVLSRGTHLIRSPRSPCLSSAPCPEAWSRCLTRLSHLSYRSWGVLPLCVCSSRLSLPSLMRSLISSYPVAHTIAYILLEVPCSEAFSQLE